MKIQLDFKIPAMQEMQEMLVQSRGQEDPLEEEIAPHSQYSCWEMPWTEKLGRLWAMGSQRFGHD